MRYTEYTLWLTPREPLRSNLRSTIYSLADSFDAVAFEPHVTVFCGASSDHGACALAEQIAGQFGPIELTAEGLEHTERYTKTLFVQFHESAILRQMFGMAARNCSGESDYVLNPHLSLLYKQISETTRRELCQTLDLPVGTFRFDHIRIIETELPILDAGQVARWRVVCEAALKGTQRF